MLFSRANFSSCIYVILLFKDPKLLQSERYRLADKKLDLIAQQGDDAPSLLDSITGSEIGGESND